MTSVDSNFNFLCGRPHGAGPPLPIHMRPPEPDPLCVDVINGWPLSRNYSNQLSLEIVGEMLFLKDAANFKHSASPKNILAELLEMSLIDLFPNISIALRIFLTLPVSVAEAECTFFSSKIS